MTVPGALEKRLLRACADPANLVRAARYASRHTYPDSTGTSNFAFIQFGGVVAGGGGSGAVFGALFASVSSSSC
jgi:hypothetical protein